MVDTIEDPGWNQPAGAMRRATGILFDGDQPGDMAQAISRAMGLRATPEIWHAMQVNGMKADFTWKKTVPAYTQAYQALRPEVLSRPIADQRPGIYREHAGRPALGHAAMAPVALELAAGKDARLRRLRKSKGVSLGTMVSHSAPVTS
jgi:starch synthase